MGTGNFSDDFKRDAVAQITERGYPVAEVSRRLGGKPALALHVEEEVREAIGGRWRSVDRDPASEEGTGARHRGARHPKKPSQGRGPPVRGRNTCYSRMRRGVATDLTALRCWRLHPPNPWHEWMTDTD